MSTWNAKPPTETVAYIADWTTEIGDDAISSYTTVIQSGDAVIQKQENSPSVVTSWIKGGTDGTTTVFLMTVTTGSGQILEREYSLLVSAGANSFQPTSTTKRMLVEQMFAECGVNGWELDIQPDETDAALTRLDALMWELMGRGIDIGYNFPVGIGQGDIADELGCPDQAFYGLATLGAERLCPTMGKTQSKESRIALNSAMKAVRSAAVTLVPDMRLARGTPLGAGNRAWPARYPFAV